MTKSSLFAAMITVALVALACGRVEHKNRRGQAERTGGDEGVADEGSVGNGGESRGPEVPVTPPDDGHDASDTPVAVALQGETLSRLRLDMLQSLFSTPGLFSGRIDYELWGQLALPSTRMSEDYAFTLNTVAVPGQVLGAGACDGIVKKLGLGAGAEDVASLHLYLLGKKISPQDEAALLEVKEAAGDRGMEMVCVALAGTEDFLTY